jgi:uncharacterized protein (TIGR03083 family)
MRIDEHVAHIRAEGDRLVDLVTKGDPGTTTPTCPDWTLGELARHVGRVHRWAATVVRERIDHEPSPAEEESWWGEMPTDADLSGWLRDGVDGLVTSLSTAPRDLACWSFLPAPSPLAFWARRQAHEITIHRVDAELAVEGDIGPPVPIEVAVDGVDEILLAFYGRRNRVCSAQPRTLVLSATDADVAWVVRFGREGARSVRTNGGAATAEPADAVAAAPARGLYLALWNRGRLAATGDPEVAELWHRQAHIRWS